MGWHDKTTIPIALDGAGSGFEISKQGLYSFADKDARSVPLPSRPYMALRIVRLV